MGKHSANSGGPFNRRRSAGRAAEHSRRGMRMLTGSTTGARPHAPNERLNDVSSRRRGTLESAPARLKAERDRRRRRYKRIGLVAGSVVVLLLVAAIAGAWVWASNLQGTISIQKEKLDASLEKVKPQEPYTVLLLGGDKRDGDTAYRTDTMILAKVDPQKKQMWMISIPRDTRVEIPGHGSAKINQAFTYGQEKGAVEAVKQLTGVKINHYMQVDFTGFSKAVDALGGVWVDVPVEIDDYQASSHSRNHSAQHIDAGYQLLDGDHALTFVRARHQFVDQDFSRMKNQQIFFKALADQVAKTQNLAKLPKVVNSVAPYIKTDMSLMDMIRTAQALRSAGSKNLYTATIPGEWRTPFIYPDEEKMAELVEKLEAGVSFEATATPSAAGGAESSSAKEPGDITVTIRNGGGVSGCAKQASSILKARGYDVGEVGNANQFVYEQTLVVYKDEKSSAEQVSGVLPPGSKIVESRGMYAFNSDVLIVIGKDWDLSKVPVAPVTTE